MNTPEVPFVRSKIDMADACPEELIIDEDEKVLIFRSVKINRLSGIYVFDYYSPEGCKM